MKLRELIEQLQALPDDGETEVFVQMLPSDGGKARAEDQSGSVSTVISGDFPGVSLSLGVTLEAQRD